MSLFLLHDMIDETIDDCRLLLLEARILKRIVVDVCVVVVVDASVHITSSSSS